MNLKISGYLKIKRKNFWVTRYGIIINERFIYYKSQDSTEERGSFDLREIYIKTKIVLPNEKIIILNKINNID